MPAQEESKTKPQTAPSEPPTDPVATPTDAAEATEASEPSAVYRAILKRAAGEPLTDEERALLKAYWAKYKPCKKTIHVKQAKGELWTRLAQEKGISLSEWINQMVDAQITGDPRVQDLERRMAEKDAEIANANRMMGKFAQENGELHGRLEGIESNLIEANHALRQALGVPKA